MFEFHSIILLFPDTLLHSESNGDTISRLLS